ncbi:MAG: polysaccharide pyruvyl transferase CsaB [Negativicutes bacterium]|nr:polysaccharide pyruvyl transferase CsaB [Negativicutes bacterium]
MKKIVISGYYGFGNSGDEAMLAVMIRDLKEYCRDELDITVISGDPEATAFRHRVSTVYKFDIRALLKVIRGCDLLISGGGSLLQNVTSKRSIYYYLAIIGLARLLKRPVVLFAHGIGPVRGRLANFCLRWVLNRTQAITVRDINSYHLLERLLINRPHTEITADPVMAVERQSTTAGRKELTRAGVPPTSPIIGISVRTWPANGQFRLQLAQALDELAGLYGASIVFFPMQRPSDVEAAKAVAEQMRCQPYVIEKFLTVEEMLSLCGCFRLLIALRLHALIFAAVMGVPMIGLAYDPKVSSFMQSLGSPYCLDIGRLTSQQIVEMASSLWSNQRAADPRVVEKMKRLAVRNAEVVSEFLEGLGCGRRQPFTAGRNGQANDG